MGRDGMLREYRGVDTSDLPDPGHRHWSGLWALYPGLQVSRDRRGELALGREVVYTFLNGGDLWGLTSCSGLRSTTFLCIHFNSSLDIV